MPTCGAFKIGVESREPKIPPLVMVKYCVPFKGKGLCLASTATQEPEGPALASLADTSGTLTKYPSLLSMAEPLPNKER
jgi:hypothetical protein